MKQNTRIEKLMHSKRMKKIVHVTTVAMLVCPLVIGAVNALANTDASEPETAKAALTEETTTSEPQPTVESTDLPVESTEPLPSAPETTSPTESTEDTSTTILTGTADEVGLDTSSIRSAMASVEEARMYEKRYTAESFADFNSTVEQYYSNGQTIITATDWTNTTLEQDQFWINSNTNNMTNCLSKLVYDSEEAVVERHRLELAQLLQEHNARVASDYTPESWKAYTDYLNSADPNHQGIILGATQKIVSKEWNPMHVGVSGGYVYSLWPYALSLLVEADKNSADLTELQNLYDKYKALNENDYHPTNWKVFTQRIANDAGLISLTESILANPSQEVTGEVVSDLVTRWERHLSWLSPDLKLLQARYDKYLSLSELDYTPKSWQTFQSYLVENPSIVGYTEIALDEESMSNGLTVEPPRFTIDRWNKAFALLVFNDYQPEDWMKPYYKELKEILAKYKGLKKVDYTADSFKAMQEYFKVDKDGNFIEYITYIIESGKTPDVPDLEAWFKQKIAFGWAGFDLLVKVVEETKTLDELGLDSSVLRETLAKVDDVRANKSKYTAKSLKVFEGESDGITLNEIYVLGNEVLTKQYTDAQYYWAYANYWAVILDIDWRLDQLILKDTTKPTVSDLKLENARNVLAKYKLLKEVDYTPESWKAMKLNATNSKAVEGLEIWLNKDPSFELPMSLEITQSTIDTFVELLNDAMNMLVKASTENKDLDMTKLQAVYDSIGNMNQYTEKSWKEFTDDSINWEKGFWLAETKRLLGGKDVDWDKLDQAYIDKITKGLQNAIDTILVKRDNNGDNDNNSGNDNNQGSGNNGSTIVNNQSNNSGSTGQGGNSISTGKASSNKRLPETGEKETFVIFLSGLVALGLTMFSVMRKREDSF